MTYAIANFYYGIPLGSNDATRDNLFDAGRISGDLQDVLNGDEPCFDMHYSGCADESPMAFGVQYSTRDECCHHCSIPEVPSNIKEEYEQKKKLCIEQLGEAIYNEIEAVFGKPQFFMLWSTS